MFEFRTRDELEKFIQDETCTGTEAQEILEISRQALHSLVERKKLRPIYQRGQITIFWKADILQRKKELARRHEAGEHTGED